MYCEGLGEILCELKTGSGFLSFFMLARPFGDPI